MEIDQFKAIYINTVIVFAMKGDRERILDVDFSSYVFKSIIIHAFKDMVNKFLKFISRGCGLSFDNKRINYFSKIYIYIKKDSKLDVNITEILNYLKHTPDLKK